jgi:hypothetical protein
VTEILSPRFGPTYRRPSTRKHDDGATGDGATEKESSKTPEENSLTSRDARKYLNNSKLVHMSPECEFFVALMKK